MQKIKDSLPNLLIKIGWIILGTGIGTAFGYSFVVLDEVGAFTQASWELIESPLRFKHIANATTRKVWAITEENKYYCLGFPDCDHWTETEEITLNSHEEYDRAIINKNTCRPNGIKYPRDPQGKVVECALSILYFGVETRSIVYYALLDNGTIWVWRSSGPWYVGFGTFLQLISPLIGFVLGLLAYKGYQNYQKKRNKIMGEMKQATIGIIYDI